MMECLDPDDLLTSLKGNGEGEGELTIDIYTYGINCLGRERHDILGGPYGKVALRKFLSQ